MALLLVSGVIFAQTQKFGKGKITAVKVAKEINNLPANSKAIVDSLHYDAANVDAIGAGAATYEAAAFFSAATLASHNSLGNTITSVKLYINQIDSVTSFTLKFYSNQTTTVYTQAFTPTVGWNNIVLTTPFPVPATDLYIAYEVVAIGTTFPAGYDAVNPANVNGDWIFYGGSWAHLSGFGLNGNWNIRAMVDGTALTTPTASCTPLTWNAGGVQTTTTATSGTFTLTNIAGGTLTASSITGVSAPFTCTLVPASVNLIGGASTTFTFSYSPTIASVDNQTAVITTNGGVISIALSGTGVVCNTINSFPWTESFEGSFPPACWAVESPDGGTGWATIAAGVSPLPGWTGGTMTTPVGGGNNAAYATWNTGGATSNDQWLITPKISVQTSQALTFWVFWNGGYQDNLDVKVSTTTNSSASFTTTLFTTDTTQLLAGDWTQFTVPLTSYSGQDVYFAFNEHVADNFNDGAFIGLDLVNVDIWSGVNQIEQNDVVSVFPNPANDKLFVKANNLKSVEIFNITGEIVAKYSNVNVINISDLAKGSYFVKVLTDSKVITEKINIVR